MFNCLTFTQNPTLKHPYHQGCFFYIIKPSNRPFFSQNTTQAQNRLLENFSSV
ncbi:hypothetical protein [Moraxella marmotae]|uniref:hypothetical protein n=1 Tax=Moraxella marmotae TaxID=3344520 RepID=UPI0035F28137